MVNVSRRKIPGDILIRIYQLLFEVVFKSHSNEEFLKLLDEFFTPTEKIMIAKRITIIYLLIKGIDQVIIADVLKVSTATVAKYAVLFYKRETYLVSIMKEMIKKEKIIDFLDDLIHQLFIQPGIKKGHWAEYWLHEKYKLRKQTTGL